ncbi:putative external scaffolding protein [Eel River basin pequenovirus]|nr:putative external scaffolding protein [Eel River basin pequenovirus]
MRMHLPSALAALQLIDKGCIGSDFSANGILEAEWKQLKQETVWDLKQRPAIERVLNTLIFSSMDSAGIGRLQPPAEYIAAVLSTFVNPVNLMACCQWFDRFTPVDEITSDLPSTAWTPASATELFGMCIQLEHLTGDICARFEKKIGFAAKRTAEKA